MRTISGGRCAARNSRAILDQGAGRHLGALVGGLHDLAHRAGGDRSALVDERSRAQGYRAHPLGDHRRRERRGGARPRVRPLLLSNPGQKAHCHEHQYMVYPPRPVRRGRVIALHCSGAGASQWRHLADALGEPLRGAGAGALRLREQRTVDRRARLHARRRGGAGRSRSSTRARRKSISSATPTAAVSRCTWRWLGQIGSPAWRSTSRRRSTCCDRWVGRRRGLRGDHRRCARRFCEALSPATIAAPLPPSSNIGMVPAHGTRCVRRCRTR